MKIAIRQGAVHLRRAAAARGAIGDPGSRTGAGEWHDWHESHAESRGVFSGGDGAAAAEAPPGGFDRG